LAALFSRLAPAVLGLALASTAAWLALIEIDGRSSTARFKWPNPFIAAWQTVVNILIHLALGGNRLRVAHGRSAARGPRPRRARRTSFGRAASSSYCGRSSIPHFVLNVLHALLGLVRRDPGSPRRPSSASAKLSCASASGSSRPGATGFLFRGEWDFVRSYLELERMRLGDRLRVEIHADETALQFRFRRLRCSRWSRTPSCMRSPPRASGGRIAVSARSSDGRLHLSVCDDGPGTSEAAIAASPRTGLRLLQERLAALYAGRARLAFETPEGGRLPRAPGAPGRRLTGGRMSLSRVRALIAEDEAPARDTLRDYLASSPWIELVGEAVDGASAVALADEHKPDLLFLDVRLPELSGLEVARRLRHPAEIIFTTAYDRFAVAAFEIGALDYLVKPFGRERLAAAVERLRARMEHTSVHAPERVRSSLGPEPLSRLFARPGGSHRARRRRRDPARPGAWRLRGGARRRGACSFSRSPSPSSRRGWIRRGFARSTAPTSSASTPVAHFKPYDDRRLAITLKDGTVVVASRAASEELRRLAR
jgi:two-component system LytT family response regulator